MVYYRWRSWLLNHEAVLQKVPPVPLLKETHVNRLNGRVMFSPSSILNVDEGRQTVTVSAGISVWWIDSSLALDEDLIEEITGGVPGLLPHHISVPTSLLWLPDVSLAEGVSTVNIVHDSSGVARISPDGTITIVIYTVLSFSCRLWMTHYPFDSHLCPVTFGDTSLSMHLLPIVRNKTDDLSEKFGVVGEWDVLGVTASAAVSGRKGDPTFSRFVLHLRRKTTYYCVMVLVPMVLTSFLNVLVFLLPLGMGEKVSYLVTLTVSMSVFTSFFNTDMPRGLEVLPWIFILLLFIYAESFLIVVTSFFILRRYHEQKQSQSDSHCPCGAPTNRVVPFHNEEDGGINDLKHHHDTDVQNERKKKVSIFIHGISIRRMEVMAFVTALIVNTVGVVVILFRLV
ncbi:neuronal acetylcholine receptor subunit beta-3-like [Babylonia areolata]|uniref:neuronal acetylcholine receptor subunit beta-3-like n=1 Tax=Babylonia areolata TaxID=304850 RepID=UPI003FD1C14D